jgi:hypothetical protein
MIVCSDYPIPIDILGLAKLTDGLTRVEERLQRVMIDAYSLKPTGIIPLISLTYPITYPGW